VFFSLSHISNEWKWFFIAENEIKGILVEFIHPSIHPSIQPTIHSFISFNSHSFHSFVHSFVCVPAPKTCDPANQFQCGNGKCIPKTWMCDQEDDCKDGKRSDEQNCGNVTCSSNEFKCKNSKCILKDWRCDKKDDCGDNSDEEPTMCAKSMFTNI